MTEKFQGSTEAEIHGLTIGFNYKVTHQAEVLNFGDGTGQPADTEIQIEITEMYGDINFDKFHFDSLPARGLIITCPNLTELVNENLGYISYEGADLEDALENHLYEIDLEQ